MPPSKTTTRSRAARMKSRSAKVTRRLATLTRLCQGLGLARGDESTGAQLAAKLRRAPGAQAQQGIYPGALGVDHDAHSLVGADPAEQPAHEAGIVAAPEGVLAEGERLAPPAPVLVQPPQARGGRGAREEAG